MVTFHAYGEGLGFVEGPVDLTGGGLVVTSIDHGWLYHLADGATEPTHYARTGGGPNGATEGRDGRIYIAQNAGVLPGRFDSSTPVGGVQVVDTDRSAGWVCQDPIWPNDLCFGPDGMLYVTDPTRLDANGVPTRGDGRLWRISPDDPQGQLLTSLPWYPNGIGFGPERDAVYVAHTGGGRIMRFPLDAEGLGSAETFAELSHGGPDGFAFDLDGNLYVCAIGLSGEPGDVEVFDREGRRIDVIDPGTGDTHYTNIVIMADGRVALTSSKRQEILVTDDLDVAPLPLFPFRDDPPAG